MLGLNLGGILGGKFDSEEFRIDFVKFGVNTVGLILG